MTAVVIVGLICFVAGFVSAILLSKNNQNTFAKAREEILSASKNGTSAVEAVLNKYK